MGILATIQTGSGLVTAVWGAIGVVVVFGALIYIIFKFFLGQQKNVGAGIGAILAVGVVAFLASSPQTVIDAGQTIAHLIGL